MSECRLDHSREDVRKKWREQAPFLPAELSQAIAAVLEQDLEQPVLNEWFHLLKKYDLADEAERRRRVQGMHALLERLAGSEGRQ